MSTESPLKHILVLGCSGKMGAGKDYVCKQLLLPLLQRKFENVRPLFLAFADPLKQECALQYGCSFEQLYVSKDLWTRKRLQWIGSERRETLGRDVYVKVMKLNIQLHAERSGINVFILPDVRFPEEKKFIEDCGGKVFRVHAVQRNLDKLRVECRGDKKTMFSRSQHVSETALDHVVFDTTVLNDYTEDPEPLLREMVNGLVGPSSK
jgi:hypothetical protein